MKTIVLFIFMCLPVISFAQSINPIEAPIGFLRDEPKVTATILFRIQENELVKVIEKINQYWSKVEYTHGKERMVGYITNQTLGEGKSIPRENSIVKKPRQKKLKWGKA